MDIVNSVLLEMAEHFKRIVASSSESGEYNNGFIDGVSFCINEIETEAARRNKVTPGSVLIANREVKSSNDISPAQLERLMKDRADKNNELTKTMVRNIEWKREQ